MKISRWFRKYDRTLMLVLMALLLVVFLIGPVISRAVHSRSLRDIVVGTINGEPVYAAQVRVAADDARLAAQILGRALPVRGKDRDRDLAIYLLIKEAQDAGIVVGRDEVVALFKNNPKAAMRLEQVHKRSNRSLESIYDALARVNAVYVMFAQQAQTALDSSLPELEHLYRDFMQQAKVLLSVIDSKALLDQVPEPTEEEIQAHFEEAKDRETQHTDDKLVFGYRVPDRVAVEYLTVDPESVVEYVKVREKEARRFYEQHKQRYVKKVKQDTAFALGDDKSETVQLSYEEVKDRVREDCRMAKAIREAQSLVNEIHQELSRPWLTAQLGPDNRPVAPKPEQIASFEEIKERFSRDYPVIYKKTELLTREQLARERGFAQATATFSNVPVSAVSLAFNVEGLAEPDPNDPIPVLKLYQPGPFVIRRQAVAGATRPEPYQAYVFRVVQVAPAGPPASLDEVRDQVVNNLKRIKAFELAGKLAGELAEQARQLGLREAVQKAEELRRLLGGFAPDQTPTTEPAEAIRRFYLKELEPFEPKRFGRLPTFIPNVGRSELLHKKVFEVAENPPDDGRPVVSVPVAPGGKWVVAEVLEVKPIYRGEFENSMAQLERQKTSYLIQVFQNTWFSADNIFKRAGFTRAADQPQVD